jgi:hypothetical protein
MQSGVPLRSLAFRSLWTWPSAPRIGFCRETRASIWAGMISGELVPDARRLEICPFSSAHTNLETGNNLK